MISRKTKANKQWFQSGFLGAKWISSIHTTAACRFGMWDLPSVSLLLPPQLQELAGALHPRRLASDHLLASGSRAPPPLDVGRGAKNLSVCSSVVGFQPLNHSKQTCKMLPNSHAPEGKGNRRHVFGNEHPREDIKPPAKTGCKARVQETSGTFTGRNDHARKRPESLSKLQNHQNWKTYKHTPIIRPNFATQLRNSGQVTVEEQVPLSCLPVGCRSPSENGTGYGAWKRPSSSPCCSSGQPTSPFGAVCSWVPLGGWLEGRLRRRSAHFGGVPDPDACPCEHFGARQVIGGSKGSCGNKSGLDFNNKQEATYVPGPPFTHNKQELPNFNESNE